MIIKSFYDLDDFNLIKDDDLLLQINSGIFYEFIEIKNLNKKNPKRITVGEVKLNVNYALDECGDLLIAHGGHSAAAGFSIKEENGGKSG